MAGGIFVVIPNLMGFATFSPNLDKYGNSVRGVEFLTRLTQKFSFHVLDHLTFAKLPGSGEDGTKERRSAIQVLIVHGDGRLSRRRATSTQ